MNNILITGGSGLIGTRLTEILTNQGNVVSHLGRTTQDRKVKTFLWDIDKHQIDPRALHEIDVIVHLAGANIGAKRWTERRKHEILESRTKGTKLLHDELIKGNHKVKAFISASAIGYYGIENRDELCDESHPPGTDFQAVVTQRWEGAVDTISESGVRVVKIRTGVVLSEHDGALERMAKPIRYYVGAPLGSGDQYLSWIHIDDLCAIYAMAIKDPLAGVFNAVSPFPVTNKEFTRAIAKSIHKPLLLPPIPPFILRVLLGEMADLALYGCNVSAEKILQGGYVFKFTNLKEALDDLLT